MSDRTPACQECIDTAKEAGYTEAQAEEVCKSRCSAPPPPPPKPKPNPPNARADALGD